VAHGTIGRPESLASSAMPMPALRAGPGGASAVSAKVAPSFSARSAPLSAAAVLPPPAGARASDHAHAKALDRICQDLRVAVARYDYGDVGVRLGPDRWHHHELPMPHGEDLRVLGEELAGGVGRIAHHAARANDEAYVKLGERTPHGGDDARVIELPQCCGHSDPVTRYCYFSREGRRQDARAERCARDPD